MSQPVKIYTTNYCPYCIRAKGLLQRKQVAYEEIDLTANQDLREEIAKKANWMSVPMIFIGDEFIGGADELFTLEDSGELDKKLS